MAKQFEVVKPTAEVAAVMAAISTVGMERNARILQKSMGADRDLNRYLATDDFGKGLSLILDKEKVGKYFEDVSAFGMTSVNEKKAALYKALAAQVDEEIDRIREKVTRKGTLVLNDEQKTRLASQLSKHRQFIINKLTPALFELGVNFGVVEVVEVVEKAPAVVAE